MKNTVIKENKMLIIYVALCVASVPVGWWVYGTLQPHKNDTAIDASTMTNEQLESILVSSGYQPEAVKSMTREQKEAAAIEMPDYRYFITTARLYSDALSATEYPASRSTSSYLELLGLYEEKNTGGVVSLTKNILAAFNLTEGYNTRIVDIMNDAATIHDYDSFDWEQKEEALKQLRNPDSLLISTLYAYPRRREAVIIDTQSLSPVSEGRVEITSTSVIDKNNASFAGLASLVEDTRNIYRIEFTFGEYDDLYAYIAETNDNTLRIIGIYSDNHADDIRTVMWWMELGQDREKGV